jgi:hypothetical protein
VLDREDDPVGEDGRLTGPVMRVPEKLAVQRGNVKDEFLPSRRPAARHRVREILECPDSRGKGADDRAGRLQPLRFTVRLLEPGHEGPVSVVEVIELRDPAPAAAAGIDDLLDIAIAEYLCGVEDLVHVSPVSFSGTLAWTEARNAVPPGRIE